MVLPTEDKYSQTRAELLDILAFAMGGRAAEELVFHDPTTGASNDIEKATATARAMVTQYGMSERLGAVKFGQESGEVFMGRDMGHGRDYSEEVAAQVDAEVRALVENAHHEAWEILVEYRDVLDDMVLRLLDKETINKDEVLEIFAPVVKRPQRAVMTANGRRPPSSSRRSDAGRARHHGAGRPRGPGSRAEVQRQQDARPSPYAGCSCTVPVTCLRQPDGSAGQGQEHRPHVAVVPAGRPRVLTR